MRSVATAVLALAAAVAAGCTASGQEARTPAASPPSAQTTGSTEAPPAESPTEVTAGPTSPSPVATPSPTVVPVERGAFDGDRAFEFAVGLADEVGERVAGTGGDLQARTRTAHALRAAGWQVAVDPFELPQGGRSANLVATIGPAVDPSAPHVVVGGHLDTVPDTPGANDNASGIGVIVALAEELADELHALPLPVVLVAFGAEEYQPGTRVHHIGSEHLAGRHDGAVAMLSVDMVGNGDATMIVGLDGADLTLVQRLAAVAERHGLTDVVTATRGDISDHGPFAKRGVPAAFLWTGRDGRFHTPADTTEHLDPADVQRAGDLTLAWLRGLNEEDRDGLETAPEP